MISECEMTLRDSIMDLKKLIDFKERMPKKPKMFISEKLEKENIYSARNRNIYE